MRAILVLLTVFGLAACARPPAPTATETWPPPASALARAALAEWEAWGRIVIVGWPETRPAESAATPERFARLLDYWAVVPGGDRVAHRLQDLRFAVAGTQERGAADRPEGDGAAGRPPDPAAQAEDIILYEFPAWSAVFISTVARRAQMPESDLPSSWRHARYIDAVLNRAMRDPVNAPFRPHAPDEQPPMPGDLLCADRAAAPLTHWSGRLAETGRPRPMHCDVVVRTAPGVIEAVGGNVQGMVVLRRFPSDATGRVLPAPYGRPPFVLLLAARNDAEAMPPTTAGNP